MTRWALARVETFTRAGALGAQGRKALLKYVLRPPLASERLLPAPEGVEVGEPIVHEVDRAVLVLSR